MLAKILKLHIFEIEPSSRCNLSCTFCSRSLLPAQGLMTKDTFKAFLDHTPLRRSDWISFVGIGEPLINPLLPDFIKMAKERYAGVSTWITSNGQLITTERLASLLNSGLDVLDISVNGTDADTYESLMRGAKFDRLLENLELCQQMIELTRSNLRLQINYIITEENASQEESIRQFWQDRGIRHFRAQRMHNRGGSMRVNNMSILGKSGLHGRACQFSAVMSFVAWNGDVLLCSHDIRRKHVLGNIISQSWPTICSRKEEIRRKHLWPKMCTDCSDPQRFDFRKRLDADIRQAMAGWLARRFRSLATYSFSSQTQRETDHEEKSK